MGRSRPGSTSRLIFPDLAQRAGVQVGYALTAANSDFHQVTLTAYGNDGSLIEGEGITNPVQLNLFNFAQQSLLAADIFGFPAELEVEGWIEATSLATDLKGFFLTLEDGLDRVDGADAILDPGLLAILTVPSNAEVDQTQIHVVNVADELNQTSFRLVSSSGAVLQESQRAIPARGKVRESLQDLLPLSAEANDFYVVVEGDQPLAAYELIRAGNSVAGLNGIVPDQVERLFSPQLATGPGFETSFQLLNTSGLGTAAAGAESLNLEITARAEDGQLLDAASQNPRQVNLAAGQLLQMDAAAFFGIPVDSLRSGWIEIAAGTGMVGLRYGAAVPAGTFVPSFRFSNRGLFDGPSSNGNILLDPIELGSTNLTMDLTFPELVAVTGEARDAAGEALSGFRSMIFTSDSATISSDRETDFRVLLPLGQTFRAEINRDLQGQAFNAGRALFEVADVLANQDQDLGELRFADLPTLITRQVEFRDQMGRPVEGGLITAEMIELVGAPEGLRYLPRAYRSDSDGVGTLELLPGRYRIDMDCELCR